MRSGRLERRCKREVVKHCDEGHQVVTRLAGWSEVKGLRANLDVLDPGDGGSRVRRGRGVWFEPGDLVHDFRELPYKLSRATADIECGGAPVAMDATRVTQHQGRVRVVVRPRVLSTKSSQRRN